MVRETHSPTHTFTHTKHTHAYTCTTHTEYTHILREKKHTHPKYMHREQEGSSGARGSRVALWSQVGVVVCTEKKEEDGGLCCGGGDAQGSARVEAHRRNGCRGKKREMVMVVAGW